MDRQVETTTSVRKFIGVGVIGPGCSLVALSRRDGRHRDAPHLVTLPVEARQLGEENVVLTVTLSEMRGNYSVECTKFSLSSFGKAIVSAQALPDRFVTTHA